VATTEYYGTGRRKSSTARVYLRPGSGAITINRRTFEQAFPTEALRTSIKQPLVVTENADKFDVLATISGGGIAGQAGALRLGIARALAIDPKVLLMDEPFGALDAQTRETLQGELLDIHSRTGKTILFVTHDLDEAVIIADRVVVMKDGRVQEIMNVPLKRPRPDLGLVRGMSEFAETRYKVWRALHDGATVH